MENDQLVVSEEKELQQRYVRALIRANPGLGEKSERIAQDLMQTGLSSTEAMMLINLVYAPAYIDGRGQGTRLKYFAKALQDRYGDCYLANIGQNEKVFRGFLAEIDEAVAMRDLINEELSKQASISFDNALLLQEIGLSADAFLGYVHNYATDHKTDRLSALLRVIHAARRIKGGALGSLESFLAEIPNTGEDN